MPIHAPRCRAHDGRRMVIAAVDAAARTQGLRPSMSGERLRSTPLAHAMAMVPDLVVADADPEGDGRALSDLAAWCLHVSPMTAPDPPDGLWIDTSGCAHLHGGEQSMLDTLVRRLAAARLFARAGLADTPGAAHAVARHGTGTVAIIASGGQADALALLPLRALRIANETAGSLHRLGFDLIGQLYTTPRGPLARRFGDTLLLRLDQAMGRVAEPIRPVLPPETISIRRTFVEPIATAEAFATVILALVGEACAMLKACGTGARTLDLVFERVDGSAQVVRIGTARPVRDPMHLARLLDERIETVDPGLGVEAMRLVLPLVEPLAPAQRISDLGENSGEAADIAVLIDRLSNRLGAGRVYRVASVESDVPERAVASIPPLALSNGRSWTTPWPRPARLLPRPEPVDAMGLLPDHPPRTFTWRRVRHRVVHADGPERITGEWCRRSSERAAVRDYWVVEDENGCRFWLFRQGDGLDPATGGLAWFLHGFF
jgi:protein ImuB